MDEFEMEDLFEEEGRNVQLSDGEADDEQDNDQPAPVPDATQPAGTRVPPPKKRVIQNPRPKLDANRLCGKRGIPILPKTFEDVKFKGKGYEKEDLDCIMSVLAHWAHRLYPRQKFDEVLEKIEKLGSEKPVKVCIQKIRMDMPILQDDEVLRSHQSDNEDDIPGIPVQAQDFEDPFDSLLQKEEMVTIPSTSIQVLGISNDNVMLTHHGEHSSSTNTSRQELTEEQRERIKISRQKALERRLLRQQAQQGNSSTSSTYIANNSCAAVMETSRQDILESDGIACFNNSGGNQVGAINYDDASVPITMTKHQLDTDSIPLEADHNLELTTHTQL